MGGLVDVAHHDLALLHRRLAPRACSQGATASMG